MKSAVDTVQSANDAKFALEMKSFDDSMKNSDNDIEKCKKSVIVLKELCMDELGKVNNKIVRVTTW